MTSPYRETRDRLGEDAREYDAAAALGRWRVGVRARFLSVGAVLGAVVGFLGFWASGAFQLLVWERNWVLMSVVIGFALPFLAALTLGMFLANRRIHARMPAEVDRLAAHYQIERDRLAEVARLVDEL